MAAQRVKTDAHVRSFLQTMGHGAKQCVFEGLDYETFIKLPDNILRKMGLSDSFVEDFTEAKASLVQADKTVTGRSAAAVDRSYQTRRASTRGPDSERDEPEYKYREYWGRGIPRSTAAEDRVTSLTMPLLGDGCCGGHKRERVDYRINAVEARPQSPAGAYYTRLSEYE